MTSEKRREEGQKSPVNCNCIRWCHLVSYVRSQEVSAVERPLGEFAVGEKGDGCAGLGVERETTVHQLYPRVGYRLPCLRLGAFLGLDVMFTG